MRPKVHEEVLSPGLQITVKNAEKEDLLRVAFIEARMFKSRYGSLLEANGYTDERLVQDMWYKGRRDLKDRLMKPLPISSVMEMMWTSPHSGMDY